MRTRVSSTDRCTCPGKGASPGLELCEPPTRTPTLAHAPGPKMPPTKETRVTLTDCGNGLWRKKERNADKGQFSACTYHVTGTKPGASTGITCHPHKAPGVGVRGPTVQVRKLRPRDRSQRWPGHCTAGTTQGCPTPAWFPYPT